MNQTNLIKSGLTAPNRPVDPILGSTEKVISSTNSLYRLVSLSKEIKNGNTEIAAVKKVWEQSLQQLDSSNAVEVKERMIAALDTLQNQPTIYKIYISLLDKATTPEALAKCAKKFIKDIASLNTFALVKTTLGANGPTHIVGYSRFCTKSIFAARRDYVVKWTNWNEIHSSHLYETLTQNLPHGNQVPLFCVPKTAALDFDKQIHEMSDGTQIPLEQETTCHLKQSFLATAGENNSSSDTQIAFFEKINGTNLFEFVHTKYRDLDSSQKEILFEKIGQLTLLDLLLGNPDRLFRTKYNAKTNQYQFDIRVANLGNLMILWDQDSSDEDEDLFELYAIDNSIDSSLITNENQKAAYKQFLQNTLTSDGMESLADVIISFLRESLENKVPKTQSSRARTNRKVAVDNNKKVGRDPRQMVCNLFLQDLKDEDIAKPALIKGLCKMLETLSLSLPGFWESEQALNIKNYLKQSHPALLDAISERFEIFSKRG